MKILVILDNGSGEIDREECETEDGIDDAVDRLVDRCTFSLGDSIKIIEAE